MSTSKSTFTLSISETTENFTSQAPEKTLVTEPLTREELQSLLSRVPPIPAATDDQKPFFQREESLQNRPQESVQEIGIFPVSDNNPKPETTLDLADLERQAKEQAGAVKITRFTPEGDQWDAVRSVTISFNQPMVPIESVSQVSIVLLEIHNFPSYNPASK
jgi:hypothetical protein